MVPNAGKVLCFNNFNHKIHEGKHAKAAKPRQSFKTKPLSRLGEQTSWEQKSTTSAKTDLKLIKKPQQQLLSPRSAKIGSSKQS